MPRSSGFCMRIVKPRCGGSWVQRALDVTHFHTLKILHLPRTLRWWEDRAHTSTEKHPIALLFLVLLASQQWQPSIQLCFVIVYSSFRETGTLGTLMSYHLFLSSSRPLVRYYSILRSRRTIICSCGLSPCCDSLSSQHAWEKPRPPPQ